MSLLIQVDGQPLFGTGYAPEDGYSLHKAVTQSGLNTGGNATFLVPRENPRYNDFVALRSVVEVYRNDKLRWRGRSILPGRDLYGRKTVVCEGELCFLQDSSQRLRSVTGTPTAVFTDIISAHNSSVEDWKQFAVGTVSVTVPGDSLSLDLTGGLKTYAAVQALVATYGGYIIFDSLPDGSRRINWFSEPPYTCNQQIKLGYNLLDFNSSGNVSHFATRLIPYGAQLEDGSRLTLNLSGVDYVEDGEAVAARGVVEATVIYDGVTDQTELERLARQDLARMCVLPETLQLSAADMSFLDLEQDAFQIGQKVTAVSELHDMSGQYHLATLMEDLLDPAEGSVTLTRDAKYMDKASGTLTESVTKKDQETKEQFSSYVTMVVVITQRIIGARGGAVRLLDTDGDELPDTLFIADNPDPEKAEKVWRFNYEGWGGSKTGFNGPFIMGATLEDGILASAITAATLVAGTIRSADGTSFLLDLDNNTIQADALKLIVSGKTFDQYNQETQNQLAQFDIRADAIQSSVTEELNGVRSEMTDIRQTASAIQAEYTKFAEDGVTKLVSKGVTVDERGLTVSEDGKPTSSTLDHDGLEVNRTSDGETVLSVKDSGVDALNVTVRKYLTIGNYSRIEDYSDGTDTRRTGIFWIGGDT